MLALNITQSLRGDLSERRVGGVQDCAERWWAVTDATLNQCADRVLAVAMDEVVGVFTVRGWTRDADHDNEVVFDLAPADDWEWLIGEQSPVKWTKSRAKPVRKVSPVLVDVLRDRMPHRISSRAGWALEVAPDGRSAVLRGPGRLSVTTVGGMRVGVELAPDTNDYERSQ